ncbi:MAG TPA: SGNH/GDSL hydrolase family protein [Devosiaceae bacterium]|nr:SGNH/GDSL hydrolase family protein [Devosiaceae bacterium]
MTQKVILAYGDSLTFGHYAEKEKRHAYEDRWPTVLEAGLGGAARVIAEGLGGRTTAFDDFAASADRNGATLLPSILSTHTPLDLVILFLGSNDMKSFINGSALGAAHGIKRLVEIIKTHPYSFASPAPKVMVVSPPHLVPTNHPDLGPMFADRIQASHELAGHYERVAKQAGVGFFDAAKVAVASPFDGIHLDIENTRAIGAALVPVVKEVLGL